MPSVAGSMPLLGRIGPLTVGSAAVPCADALETLVESTTTRTDNIIIPATATRVGIAKLYGLMGPS